MNDKGSVDSNQVGYKVVREQVVPEGDFRDVKPGIREHSIEQRGIENDIAMGADKYIRTFTFEKIHSGRGHAVTGFFKDVRQYSSDDNFALKFVYRVDFAESAPEFKACDLVRKRFDYPGASTKTHTPHDRNKPPIPSQSSEYGP